jgi:AcrR family transcriptional regulator
MSITEMKDKVMTEDKQSKVLKSAYDVFLRYGFRRTTMDDIAKDAGMSRPALYLVFKNKEEIFRALAQSVCDSGIAGAEALLKKKQAKPEKLLAILDVSLLNILETLSHSPHGSELMGVEDELAADIDEYWHENTCRVLAEAIGGSEAQLRAALVLDAVNGMKKRGVKIAGIRTAIMGLLKLV